MSYISDHKSDIYIGAAVVLTTVGAAVAGRKVVQRNFIRDHSSLNASTEVLKKAEKVHRRPLIFESWAKNLNLEERYLFKKSVKRCADDVRIFRSTMSGDKPACILSLMGKYKIPDSKFLEKIEYSKNIDIVHCADVADIHRLKIVNSYVLNRNEVMKVIERNKEIYTNRLGLAKNSSVETIYEELKKCLSGKSLSSADARHDIVGLTLGFPKHNTMIFQLERTADIPLELRKNPEEYKKVILETLHGEKSPYKNLSAEEIKSLEKSINDISKIEGFHNIMYDFIKYTDEPEEFARIKAATESYIKKLLNSKGPLDFFA